MGEKMFPIQSHRGAAPHPHQIPWSIAELAYSVYSANYGRGQSLERLAERGGFGPGEMDEFLPDWRERCSEIATLRAELAEAKRETEMVRTEARKVFDRNEIATKYEQWLLELGRLCGCGHLDERLLCCIREHVELLADELAEARRALLAGPDKILRCAFCGHEYPDGTPAAKHDALRQHVRRCKAHPLYIEFMDYLRAECDALGADPHIADDDENPPLRLAARIALKQIESRERISKLEQRLARAVGLLERPILNQPVPGLWIVERNSFLATVPELNAAPQPDPPLVPLGEPSCLGGEDSGSEVTA